MIEMNERIYTLLDRLPKKAAVNLLLAAIDEMQSYNGQSHTSAICRAMGAEEKSTEKGGTSWKMPSFAQIKRTFCQ